MKAYTLSTSQLFPWLDALMRSAEVVGPQRVGDDTFFAALRKPGDIFLAYTNTLEPPKRIFYPQVDTLLRASSNGRLEVAPVYDETERVLFGVRSCDVSAIRYLDRVFSADLPDIYYLGRRERSAIISLACNQPAERCFCICADAGPFLASGFDIQLTDLGDRYLAEVATEKGERLVAAAPQAFAPAQPSDIEERQQLEETSRNSFAEPRSHFASAMRRMSGDRVAKELWTEMGEWCFGCGGCNHICPTCYCFTVTDETAGRECVRCRSWDSCQYAGFTREASGHNPRPGQGDRQKRRFFHKLSYQYCRKNDDQHGCVGCGRCITVCLGRNDMPAVAEAIRRGAWA